MKKKIVALAVAIMILYSTAVVASASGGPGTGSSTASVTNTAGSGSSYSFGYAYDSTFYGALSSERPDVSTDGAGASVAFNSNKFTITATSSAGINKTGSWWDKSAQNVSTEVTITNNSQSTLEIGYTYSASGGTTDGSNLAVGSGTFTWIPGQSIFLRVKTQVTNWQAASSTATATFQITSCEEVANYDLRIYPSQFGSYTYSVGSDVTGTLTSGSDAYVTTASVSDTITLSVPEISEAYADRYYFYGWSVNGLVKASDKAYTAAVTTHTTVYPVIIQNGTVDASGNGPFYVNGEYYVFWREAFLAAGASHPVVLARDYTLPTTLQENGVAEPDELRIAGDADKAVYIIPSGGTFLIPNNTAHTVYTKAQNDGDNTYKLPTVYCTLTMANGANIVVNGNLSLAGKIGTNMGGKDSTGAAIDPNGAPSGPLGHISMAAGSNITVNAGANLYAWGYILGSGSVEVKNGGAVYEAFQVTDWRGGSVTSGMVNNKQKVLPLSQFYIQNIQVPLKLNAGAKEFGSTAFTISYVGVQDPQIEFIGANGLFNITSGHLVKDYDEAADRMVFTANGDFTISNMAISMKPSLLGGTITINSKDYVLPIHSGITINVESGNVSVTQDMAILPGAEVNIGEKATATMGEGKNLYIYDAENWGRFCYFNGADRTYNPVSYVPTGRADRSATLSADGKMRINGTFDASKGGFYTTTAGGNIYSTSNEGKVILGANNATTTYQYSQIADADDGYGKEVYVPVGVTGAQLKHGDGSNMMSVAGTYNYTDGRWVCATHTGMDADHTCDVCGYVTPCADTNPADHNCDICGNTISECRDEVGDSLCDICGKNLCTHAELTAFEAVAPTCTEKGNSAYWQCNACNMYFSDETATTPIENGKWVQNELGHITEDADNDHICDREGCTAAISTCKEKAEHTPAKAPTCTEKGNSAYWTCQTCGKFYSDADCTAEIAKDSWVIQINPDAHTFGQPQFTWNDYECSAKVVCDCNAEQRVDVTVTPEVTTTATCTVRGVKTYTATAVYNGETYTAEKQPTEDLGLNTDNHQNTTEHGQSNATCTENGYTAGTYCNDCKTWISGHEVIESNGHTYANPVVVFSQDGTTYTVKVTCSVCKTAEKTSESKTSTVGETTPGDCQTNSTTIYTASGSYEGVSYSETKTVEGAKGDHSDANNDGNHTCDREGCTETVSNCEDKDKDHICDTDSACTVYSTGSNEHTPAAGSHDCAYCGQAITECEFTVQGDVKIPATCVTKAVYEAKCSVCGTVSETETIEGVVDPEAHNLMDIPAQTATCTQIGWNAYQKCQNEGCNYSTYVEIPMLEHDYADKWSSNGSGHWHACKNCTATIDATTHTEAEAVKENEIAPTYNTTGSYDSVVYCSVCNYEIRRKTVTEPMLQGVAKVGDTNYGTLADAVEAAEDGQTVTLLTDAELTERLTVKKKIVLDLSGKTITADFTDDFGAIYIGTSGDLTVTGNGTVLSVQDIIFANYGKITIENGTFKSEGETYNAALYNMYHSGDVYGTATIKGGNFETDVWNSGMLTVEDGTLEGIDNSGKTVITGGTANGEILNGDGSDAPDLAEKGTIAIYDGTFANAVDQTWCAEGYGPTDNGDGTYGVHLHTAGTAEKENVVAATCTTDGSYDTVVRCTQCYAVLSTQTTVVGKLNHEDLDNDGDHICDHEGCNAVVTTCGDSDKDHICDTDSACTAYSTGENAHGDGDDANHTCDYCSGTVEGEVCTDNNSDHKCDECGQTMSQCSDEDADHDCDVCGATMGTHEAAEGKHTCDYCGKTVTQCSDSDDTDHKCDTCGQDNITDHVYGEVTYTGDGINSYAAERSCACGEKQTASVTITSAVTREATCTAEGETTYTADFAEDWAQDKTTTETIAKKPHTYGDLAWSWTGSDETGYTAATATFQCSCGDTQTETDDKLEKVTTDATYEAAGSDVYTAVVNFKDKAYTDTKTVTIAQLVKPTGYTVTLDDRSVISKGKATTTLDETKKYNAGDTFTVTCAEACVVAISTDNKETYEELSCVNVDGNTYRFTVPEDIDCNFWILIALKGDVNLDGNVTAVDGIFIARYLLPESDTRHFYLDEVTSLTADTNDVGGVTAVDKVFIARTLLPTNDTRRYVLTWNTSSK